MRPDGFMIIMEVLLSTIFFFEWSLVLQIPYENVFRHPKPTPKPLAEGIGAYGGVFFPRTDGTLPFF